MVSRIAVGPCWHDDIAYTIVLTGQCIILEVRLEVLDKQWQPAFVYLKCVGKPRLRLAASMCRHLALIWWRCVRRARPFQCPAHSISGHSPGSSILIINRHHAHAQKHKTCHAA
jgi:hypothetical protein